MRNKLIIAGLVVLGLAAVTYAAFSQNLIINGTGSIGANWDVKITGITPGSSNGATANGAPSFTSTSATFDVDLAYPGAYAEYQVAVENGGTVNAKLDSISGVDTANAAAPTDVQYTVSGVVANTTTLAAGDSNTATVRVEWDPASTAVDDASKTATITLNYVQDTP
ncbi:hypothetical protein CR969_00215 [Candidatus Saccharibacteria bacterium]|nr:MAG: hypothetical protein CR969_00215 [Candidatus Saccharibacteria bacterium]